MIKKIVIALIVAVLIWGSFVYTGLLDKYGVYVIIILFGIIIVAWSIEEWLGDRAYKKHRMKMRENRHFDR